MKPVSHVLRDMLSRQGMHDRTAGTVLVVVNGDEASAGKSAQPHQPAGREDNRPMGRKGPAVKQPAKFEPRVIDGGSTYLGTAQPTRMPRAAVSKYPLLVFSR